MSLTPLGGWGALAWWRSAALNAFGDALDAKKNELAEALCKEQGKPLAYAMGEVVGTIKKCRHLAEIGDLAPEVRISRGVA